MNLEENLDKIYLNKNAWNKECMYMTVAKSLNERDYHEIYEDRNEFLDYQEDMFCDENKGSYIRVPCLELPEENRLFIAETIFNQYWEHICTVLLESKRNLDFSWIETKSREAYIGANYKIAYRGKVVDLNKQRQSSKRANAVDNHKIRFALSKKKNVLHDKTCETIKNEDVLFLEQLPTEYELCSKCKRKVYVWMGIKEETKYFNLYYNFLMNMNLSDKCLRHLFQNQGVMIHMDSEKHDRMYVKYRKDNWYIQVIPEGRYRYELYHNNYRILQNKERVICNGYHNQNLRYTHPSELFRFMESYNWRVHLKEEEKKEITVESTIVEDITNVEQTFWQSIKVRFCRWWEVIKSKLNMRFFDI